MISFKEFQKIDLRVAEIKVAERVAGTDKLMRMEINMGEDEDRQIVAGIAPYYAPEDLVGKKIIVVANLEPAKIRGVESRGMLLAAVTEGMAELALLSLDKDLPAGTKVS